MFNKKCINCRQKINWNFDFCPFCGKNQKSVYDEEDYGMLGKNDIIEKDFFSSSGDSFLEKMFESAFKVLEKQMKDLPDNFLENQKQARFSAIFPDNLHVRFFVNGKRIFPEETEIIQKKPVKIQKAISRKKKESLATLPRIEPSSKIRRMPGKIIYELAVPGVKDIKDILINRLENSIEIKAISDRKIYSKTLNLKLPVIGYRLKDENLILEFQGQ